MKKLLLSLTLATLTSASFASVADQAINNRTIVEKAVMKLNALEKLEASRSRDTDLFLAQSHEPEFWSHIQRSYQLMMNHQIKERYQFAFGAIEASAIRNPEARRAALQQWLSKENEKFSKLKVTPLFSQNWEEANQSLGIAIQQMKQKGRGPSSDLSSEIRSIARNLQAIDLSGAQSPVETVVESSLVTGSDLDKVLYTFFGTSILFSGLYFIGRRRKNVVSSVDNQTESSVVVRGETPDTETPRFPVLPTHDLETICQSLLEDNRHLLDLSQVKILPRHRSPFNTTVLAPVAAVKESLQGFLKGTLAIANSSSQRASELEWSCFEQEGRLSLEFTLHGIECDAHALYLNTLMDGDGSAPAHFGRAERSLSSHLASVSVQKGQKKTTVRLGLDSCFSSMVN